MVAWKQQRLLAACLLLPLVLIGCGRTSRDVGTVHSFLEGTITLSAALDSTGDFSGFEVLIASLADDDLDTLGIASTDSTGRFAMDIVAPNAGIYPLYLRRGGGLLKQDQIVVADGDSATTTIRLPLGNRPVMIRSNQNAAWMAYRNVKARHNTVLYEAMRTGTLDEATMGSGIRQTAEIMWSLRSTYPGTMGAQIASAESVVMLEGWDDRLVLDRALSVAATDPGYVDVARAARRAAGRSAGIDSALTLLRHYQSRTQSRDDRAELQAEVVLTHLDSLLYDQALEAARVLRSDYGDTEWVAWAESAIYEVETLRPGSVAPEFTVEARDNSSVTLSELTTPYVLIEFYLPDDVAFQREANMRDSLAARTEGQLTILSVSLHEDDDINSAFLDYRELPGIQIVAAGGADGFLGRLYNVKATPKRFLLHNGDIVSTYSGQTLALLAEDLARLLNQPS